MMLEFDFSKDREFSRLLARDTHVDLAVGALELARDAYPDLEFQPVLDWIDARAAQLRPTVLRTDSEREALEAVASVLGGDYAFEASPHAFQTPDGSYLHRVIETGEGIPISLSVLYMAVCERLDIDLQGVNTPRHFLTRLETSSGPLFMDAASGGRILSQEVTIEWLTAMTNQSASEVLPLLEPVNHRAIIGRMLHNLKVLNAHLEQWDAAWTVQHRLTALSPADYAERRDLALLSTRSNRPGLAIQLIETLLGNCPSDEREMLNDHLEQARADLARWN